MYEKAKQFTLARPRFKKTVGWVCVIVGGVAFIMPLVPGFPLLIIGLELVGLRLIFLDRILRRQPAPVLVKTADQTSA
jgi:hypothetical protein